LKAVEEPSEMPVETQPPCGVIVAPLGSTISRPLAAEELKS
jgi:hypothetical protein